MSTTTRKQAPRPAKPVGRYWKGKAPKGVVDVESDSDAEDDEAVGQEPGDVSLAGDHAILDEDEEDEEMQLKAEVDGKVAKTMNIALRDVNISKDGKVTVAGRDESGRTAMEQESDSDEESEDEKAAVAGKDSDSEEESSEYESESDEEPSKPQFRPVFVPKRARATITARDALLEDTEEAIKRKELEAEERKKQSHDLVAESIKRELAEKEQEELVPDVDDTDGLDPAAEFEAWRLRELGRIKKEKEEEVRREQEREEVERRRALPEEQRMKEDLEHAQKLREAKPKGQQKFLQKYWHKGAFHQDADILKRHDFTGATESTVDVSLLPKVMQVRDFGKRSRTKYTHLLDQDTTVASGGFGGTAPVKAGGSSMDGGGCFLCGGPHLKKGFAFVFCQLYLIFTPPLLTQIAPRTQGRYQAAVQVGQAQMGSLLAPETKVHGGIVIAMVLHDHDTTIRVTTRTVRIEQGSPPYQGTTPKTIASILVGGPVRTHGRGHQDGVIDEVTTMARGTVLALRLVRPRTETSVDASINAQRFPINIISASNILSGGRNTSP
ncbi:hypothetical protein HGRIS_007290 [Hohenbuehelia grisea]|uniref:Micro-fibrillar-associated protein 1 C-terminal domain-containing protein n=1 Tax=Hohenbuehelia grisea TaxID=104357 RepID=A0ABR3J4B0_9AGAR